MPKSRIDEKRNFTIFKERERADLRKKYYDLFYSKIKIEGDLNEQQKDYLIKTLYYKGKICILKRIDGKPLLCPFEVSSWNNEDWPVNIGYINKRNLKGVFPKKMTGINMQDCVIGYIRPSKINIASYVDDQIDKIVDLEVTIKINQFVQRLPFLVGVSQQDKPKFDRIITKMWNGEIAIFEEAEDLEAIKPMTAPQYNIDKLRAEKESIENELKTQLGINNNNNIKKERMVVDEVNANNDEIESSSNVYLTPLEAFSKNIKDVLGFNINITWDAPLGCYEEEEEDNEDDE